MVCYTLDEQNEIINEFLKVIDINDNKQLIKSDIETCRMCKMNLPNTYLFQTFPTEIAKNICQYSFNECNGCKKIKLLLEYNNENKIMLEKLIKAIRDRQHTDISPQPFEEDDIKKYKYLMRNEIKYYFTRLNPYPTYQKIVNKILTAESQKNIYTKKLHKDLKACYENHWQLDVKIARGEGLDVNRPIDFWKKENTDQNIRKALNEIIEYIERNQDKKEIAKLTNHDYLEINRLNRYLNFNWMIHEFKTDFSKNKGKNTYAQKNKINNDYLNSACDFE